MKPAYAAAAPPKPKGSTAPSPTAPAKAAASGGSTSSSQSPPSQTRQFTGNDASQPQCLSVATSRPPPLEAPVSDPQYQSAQHLQQQPRPLIPAGSHCSGSPPHLRARGGIGRTRPPPLPLSNIGNSVDSPPPRSFQAPLHSVAGTAPQPQLQVASQTAQPQPQQISTPTATVTTLPLSLPNPISVTPPNQPVGTVSSIGVGTATIVSAPMPIPQAGVGATGQPLPNAAQPFSRPKRRSRGSGVGGVSDSGRAPGGHGIPLSFGRATLSIPPPSPPPTGFASPRQQTVRAAAAAVAAAASAALQAAERRARHSEAMSIPGGPIPTQEPASFPAPFVAPTIMPVAVGSGSANSTATAGESKPAPAAIAASIPLASTESATASPASTVSTISGSTSSNTAADATSGGYGSDRRKPIAFTPNTYKTEAKYKTKLCKNFFESGMCRFATRCKFIHDEQRVQVSDSEFWLVSPADNLVRVEVAQTAERRQQLQTLTTGAFTPPIASQRRVISAAGTTSAPMAPVAASFPSPFVLSEQGQLQNVPPHTLGSPLLNTRTLPPAGAAPIQSVAGVLSVPISVVASGPQPIQNMEYHNAVVVGANATGGYASNAPPVYQPQPAQIPQQPPDMQARAQHSGGVEGSNEEENEEYHSEYESQQNIQPQQHPTPVVSSSAMNQMIEQFQAIGIQTSHFQGVQAYPLPQQPQPQPQQQQQQQQHQHSYAYPAPYHQSDPTHTQQFVQHHPPLQHAPPSVQAMTYSSGLPVYASINPLTGLPIATVNPPFLPYSTPPTQTMYAPSRPPANPNSVAGSPHSSPSAYHRVLHAYAPPFSPAPATHGASGTAPPAGAPSHYQPPQQPLKQKPLPSSNMMPQPASEQKAASESSTATNDRR